MIKIVNDVEFFNNLIFKDKSVKFRLKDIFSDHWDNFVKDNPNLFIRDVVFKEVEKMINCRTSALGYSLFECPHCGELKLVFHTCKSRFCPSYGVSYV